MKSDPFRAARLILTLRRAGVTDNAVLAAMEDVPRDRFVSEDAADLAFEDAALPIAHGQTVLRPSVTGHMLQLAELQPGHRALLVGLGSGYTAALLAELGGEVFAVERHRVLLDRARDRLDATGNQAVETLHGDGLAGWPDKAPFDRILLSGIAEAAPVALLSQLTGDGRLIQPVSEDFGQLLLVFDKSGNLMNSLEIMGFQPLLSGIAGE